ncbi:MAG: hypothetical protein DWQ37_03485 [Planctomycetota bacterium]|nr:MAG: hypothetical protein DWQ37_03485 [Planctomycetota bacterium]
MAGFAPVLVPVLVLMASTRCLCRWSAPNRRVVKLLTGGLLAFAFVANPPVLRAEAPELPLPRYHLTARPFEPLDTPPGAELDVLEDLCRYLAGLQDERGAIIDPFLAREHQYATPYFAYAVGVLLDADRAADLRDHGTQAMEHATACLAAGRSGIPDEHGEFFLAPLTEALELYRPHVEDSVWRVWRERMRTPLFEVIEGPASHINNWRTYAMKGEWLRARAGLVARDAAAAFVADAWTRRTQRERIVTDRWNLYQDWSSDPQSHAVEAVGRGNLLALLAAGYDGPAADEIAAAVRRGTRASLLWQDPTGQCPPNGRTDNHIFNDLLYQLAFEVLSEDALARGEVERAGQYRRAARLSFRSIERWRRTSGDFAGSFFVTKNHFDPAERVGYQPASQYTNYNGAVAYHLAEAARVRSSDIAEQPVPSEIGGYVVEADARFASVVANAGGMQVVANLRGDTVPKYGVYWTPLGVVRFSRVGWESRLGPADGVRDARSRRAVTFGPTWQEAGRWICLAERADDYRGTLVTEFVHPLLVRFSIVYHSVTGRGGPTFRHRFVVTPDGVLTTLECNEDRPFGVTLPLLVDDGRPLDVQRTSPAITTGYPKSPAASGDQQCFLLLDPEPAAHAEEPIRSAVGWLQPVRVTSGGSRVSVFVYPRSSDDPPAADVQASFQLHDDGFESCLGSVRGDVYLGRTAAGGYVRQLDLDRDGAADLVCTPPCGLILQRRGARPVAVEADREARVSLNRVVHECRAFEPLTIPPPAERPPQLRD